MSNITQLTQSNNPLSAIAAYKKAKKELDAAKAIFASAESELIAIIGFKEEGAFSTKVDDRFKVTTTGKLTYSIDQDAMEENKEKLPPALLNRLIKEKNSIAVNVRELKYIRDNEPDVFAFISKFISSKPAKTALKVEDIE